MRRRSFVKGILAAPAALLGFLMPKSIEAEMRPVITSDEVLDGSENPLVVTYTTTDGEIHHHTFGPDSPTALGPQKPTGHLKMYLDAEERQIPYWLRNA